MADTGKPGSTFCPKGPLNLVIPGRWVVWKESQKIFTLGKIGLFYQFPKIMQN